MSNKKTGQLKGSARLKTRLRVGDTVMVLSGGNAISGRELKGKIGKILRFLPKTQRVIVEGLNMITRHQRPTSARDPGGKVQREAAIHISNVMFYSHDSKGPVKLTSRKLDDGRKVRGYFNKQKDSFEQIDI